MSSAIPSIAAVSGFQQAQLASQVSTAVARKSLDAAKAQGEAAISMIQAAAEVQQHALAKVPGKGACIDVCA